MAFRGLLETHVIRLAWSYDLKYQQDGQRNSNISMKGVRVTTDAVEKQYYITCVCVCVHARL